MLGFTGRLLLEHREKLSDLDYALNSEIPRENDHLQKELEKLKKEAKQCDDDTQRMSDQTESERRSQAQTEKIGRAHV